MWSVAFYGRGESNSKVMQANRFLAIMDNFGRVQEVNNELMGSAGTLAKGYETVLGSVQARADRAKASLEGMWINAINSDAIGFFYDMSYYLTRTIDFFGVFNMAVAGLIMVLRSLYAQSLANDGAFAKWANTMMIAGEKVKIQTALTNFYTESVKGKTIAEIASTIKTKAMTMAQDAWNAKGTVGATVMQALKSGALMAVGGFSTFIAFLRVASIEMVKFIALSVAMHVATAGITAVLGLIGAGFSKLTGGSKEATTSIGDLNNAIGQSSANIKTLQSVSDEYNTLTERMGKARDMSKLTADEQARYNDIMGQVEQIAPNYITYLGESNDKMLVYGKTLDDIIAKEKELIEIKKQEMINEQDVINKDIENKRAELLEKQKELDKLINNLHGDSSSQKLKDGLPMNPFIGKTTEETISSINTLKGELQTLGGEIDGLQAKQLQVLDTLMLKLDDVTGATESMKTLAKESVMEIFETEGFDKASTSIDDFAIVLEESAKMLDETGQEFDYTKDASDRLKSAFDRLDMDESDIIGFLHRLAIQLGLTKQGFEEVRGSVGYNMEDIENMQKANKAMGDMYEKLAKGDKLTTEELNKLIEGHSEIAEYIAETGDMSLQNGEILKNLWSEMSDNLGQYLENEKVANQNTVDKLEEKIALQTQSLEIMEKNKEQGKKAYKDLKAEIEGMNESLKINKQELAKTLNILEALEKANSGEKSEQSIGVSIDGMENAQKKLDSYRKIVAEINKTGKLSSETNRMIIRDHEELIGVIGNEVEMRQIIQEKIKETEDVALNYYKNILMENKSFYQKMIAENADLFNRIGKMYDINVSNFTDMAKLMAKIAEITGQEIAKAMSFSVKMNSQFSTQVKSTGEGQFARIGEVSNEIAQLEGKMKNLTITPMEIARLDALKNVLKESQNAYSQGIEQTQQSLKHQSELNSLVERAGKADIDKITSTGSTGGSKKIGGTKKNKEDKKDSEASEARAVDDIDITDMINAYLRWEQAILRVDEALSRHKIFLERATGEDRVNLIDKENNLLKEKQKLLSSLNNEQRREQATLNQRLTKWGVNTNSATQGASDVEKLVMARQSQLDSLTNQINAIKTDTPQREQLIDRRDELKEGIESLTEDFDRYIEISNNISAKSNEWWEIQSQILDNQLARIEEGLKKYDDRLTMLDQQISLLGNVRDNRPKEIEKEIELLDKITETTKNRRAELNSQLYESSQKIKQLEKSLESFGKTRNEQYKSIYQNLITEREYNKVLMDNFMQDTLNLNKAMQDATNKRVDGLKREKEGILKNIEALTEMKNIYNDRTLKVDGREIQHRLDLLNKVFREDATVRLDTSGIQSDLDKINSYYNSLKDKYDSLDKQTIFREEDVEKITQIEDALSKIQKDGITQEMKSSFKIVGTTVEEAKKELEEMLKLEKISVEENKKKAKALEEVMTNQAKLIKQNEEEAKKLQEEIEDLEFSYKEIEASLQNRIDLKEEELNQLREQYRQEEKVRQQIEKQLELLRALDDRRHSYITGTGEEVFTYDVSAVNKLRQEVDKMSREDKQQKAEEKLAEEIKQMKEELARTKEINKLDIAVRELQLTALNENTEALKNMLDKTKEDFTNVYDNLGNQLIDEFKKAMEGMVATHERLYSEYLARKAYDAPSDSFKHQGSGSPFYEQGNYGAKKGQSMSTIAKNLGTTVEALKILNPQLANETDKLSKDYNIKTPPLGTVDKFDTGGYTGNFNGGKLAMLHQKELVLNKNDTANFLDAINISRLLAKDLQVGERDWNNHQTSNNSGDQPIYIENVNLPSVKDGKSFVNELHGLLRKGQNRLV